MGPVLTRARCVCLRRRHMARRARSGGSGRRCREPTAAARRGPATSARGNHSPRCATSAWLRFKMSIRFQKTIYCWGHCYTVSNRFLGFSLVFLSPLNRLKLNVADDLSNLFTCTARSYPADLVQYCYVRPAAWCRRGLRSARAGKLGKEH